MRPLRKHAPGGLLFPSWPLPTHKQSTRAIASPLLPQDRATRGDYILDSASRIAVRVVTMYLRCRQYRPSESVQCQLILRLTLPDRQDLPVKCFQPLDHRCVSCSIGCKFALPKIRTGSRRCCVWAARMLMPETAMHEDCDSASRQCEVRTTGKSSIVQAKAQPDSVQIPTNPNFRLSVARGDRPHHPGSHIG